MSRENVLVVDDEKLIRFTLRESLGAEGYVVHEAADISEARRAFVRQHMDCVILDHKLPDGDGFDLLKTFKRDAPDVPVILMTAYANVQKAVEAMRQGAFTYLNKPFDAEEMVLNVRSALETTRLRREVHGLRRMQEAEGVAPIIGESPAMREIVELVKKLAASRANTVLLLGESGVGKGLVARALHDASERRGKPFLTITCSAIPEALLESELFGHERGAFTDAKSMKPGLFEVADGGTVFLDEIGDMPLALQAKLLGVLEDRSFSRIGSTETIQVDVRIIAATHRDLDRHVAEGRFREDLLYRLRVVPIVIPPLRERTGDIVPLAESFVQRFNREFGREVSGFTPEAEETIRNHAWPGNVRELRNVIERALLFTRNQRLEPQDLMLDPGYRPRPTAVPVAAGHASEGFVLPADGLKLDELENDLVRQAMERAGGNKSRAAKILGISRDQIRYRLEKMGEG
jgi:DNA-binding NtrC family response regulator